MYIKIPIMDKISKKTKLKINWLMIKDGVNINEVFSKNPVGLDVFLTLSSIKRKKFEIFKTSEVSNETQPRSQHSQIKKYI